MGCNNIIGYVMLDGLYNIYRLGNVGWAVSGLYNIIVCYVMLDGLYQYRLGNVGWAVSI